LQTLQLGSSNLLSAWHCTLWALHQSLASLA
jgi:hypothetical protein